MGVDFSSTMFTAARSRLEAFMGAQEELVKGAWELFTSNRPDAEAYINLSLQVETEALQLAQQDLQKRFQLIELARAKLEADTDENLTVNLATVFYIRWVAVQALG